MDAMVAQPDLSAWATSDLVTPQAPSLWRYILEPCTTVAANLDAVDFSEIPYSFQCDPTDLYGGCFYGSPTPCKSCTDDSDCGPYANYGDCDSNTQQCLCKDPTGGYGSLCPSDGMCTNRGTINSACPQSPHDKTRPTALVECKGTLPGPNGDDIKHITDLMRKFCTSMAHPAASNDGKEL